MRSVLGAAMVGVGVLVVGYIGLHVYALVSRSRRIEGEIRRSPSEWMTICSRGEVRDETSGVVFVGRLSGKPGRGIPRVTGRWIVLACDREHLGIVYPEIWRKVWSVYTRAELADTPVRMVPGGPLRSPRLVGGPVGFELDVPGGDSSPVVQELEKRGWIVGADAA